MDETRVKAYLARIGADLPARPDDEALRDLHLRHLLAVPFENLAIHLGEDIVLDEDALVAKIVDRRRGGFCYELNGAFGALLSALGYDVTHLAARVLGDDGPGIPYDHLALRAGPWLVDVGFGDHAHHPLRIDERGEQEDPGGTFRIAETADGDLDVLRDGRPAYRLETRPRRLRDFVAGCWWHRTSPASHFTRSLVCSLLTETGRITLNGRTLIRTVDGERREERLGDDAEVLAAYRAHFGVELDRVPEVRAS
ncbi:arylamine N-acetyltransferase family protein [Actinoallomurus soli]|uniref:arylamine N-acetyltransferase family protein n=1 Tax=Actinoallomurus soli TaxID=2952535 RepID=UPI0020935297|nr:arylamine N-acetyltransferase [Actinoallomurus soli]MCO5974756.1 arylamine N-acetyltransferase [Actinoallomurus soli]